MSSGTLHPAPPLSTLRQQLQSRLSRVRRALRGRLVAEASARIVVTIVGVLALSLLLDWWLELSRMGRLGFSTAGLALVGWVTWRSLIQPLSMALGPLDVAAALDRRVEDPRQRIASLVASVLQLPDHLEQPRGSSSAMIDVAVRSNYFTLERVDFGSALSGRHLAQSLATVFFTLLIPIGFALATPETARLWSSRWLAGSDQPWPRDTHMVVVGVEDGRYIVPRGEPATLQVLVTDDAEPTEVVYMRMRSTSGRDETVTLTRFEQGDFRYDLPPLQQPIDAQVWGGDGRAEPFEITPIDRPRIVDLTLRATHPRERTPTIHHFRGDEGTIRLLPHTEAVLELIANVPIANITIENEGTGPKEFEQQDETHFVTNWTHEGSVQMRIALTSTEAGLVSHPRPVTIGERPDRGPRLSLRHSGVRQRITPTASVPLQITARDDFGIRVVSLNVETPQLGITSDEEDATTDDSDEQEPQEDDSASEGPDAPASGEQILYGPTEPAIETTVEATETLEVNSLGISPGGVMTVQGIAIDDCFTGRQRTESRKTVFRIVRPEELFKEILLRQQQLRSRLRKQYEAAIELRDDIRTATLPDDAQALLRMHQLIRREVGQVSAALNASALEMRLNKLGGQETWDLIEVTVLNPLERLHAGEMELQRQSLASLLTPEPADVEEIVAQQQTVVDGLKKILDNMAQWDSFIDVVNQLNTVIKLETRVRQQTEALRSKQVESIFD